MSKRQFKAQASSGRVGGGSGAFGTGAFGSTPASVLSYIQEPTDYSLISDANVIVAYKNLSKKDSTTKAKALEDLQTYVIPADGEPEDAVLDAWVKLFPRLAIDSARRVRQLTHIFNGQLGGKCGKRIAKHLPRISGPWLAGTFDVDRTVAKAAQVALTTVFPTPEKVLGLQRTFQDSIIGYCNNALSNETVKTLSDERVVSVEEAQSTYAHVVSASINLVTSLLETQPSEEVSKHQHTYETLLGDDKLWSFCSYKDASVRRALHRLVQLCIKKYPAMIESNLRAVSTAYIYNGLPSDQTSSAVDFALTLGDLTSAFPTIWTDEYTGKKSVISRLQQCLKHGSHNGTAAFWDTMTSVIRKIPTVVISTSNELSDLILAARVGASKKEERLNASSAWLTYFSLLDICTRQMSEEHAEKLVETFAIPPIAQFLHPAEDDARWSITSGRAASLVAKVALVHRLSPIFEKKWAILADKLVDTAKMSHPEQSKDFDISQKNVASAGERWADLQRELYSPEFTLSETVLTTFATANTTILKECIALLRTRNGKPYGAAAIIDEQLRACGPQLMNDQDYKLTLKQFIVDQAPSLMYSPSQAHLARYLHAIVTEPEFNTAFSKTLQSVLDANEPEELKAKALLALIPPKVPQLVIDLARASKPLQEYLATQSPVAVQSSRTTLFTRMLKAGAVSQESTDALLVRLTESLAMTGSELHVGLTTLDQLVTTNQSVVRAFVSDGPGKALLPSVLSLESSSDGAVAARASALSVRLSSVMGDAAIDAKYGMIMQNLENVSGTSLPMDSLLDLAEELNLNNEDSDSLEDLLPSLKIWQESIAAAATTPTASLSISSPLGGTVHLIQTDTTTTSPDVRYDSEGMSQALRIALYTARVLARPGLLKKVGDDNTTVLALLNICVLLAEDNTSVLGSNGLWNPEDSQSVELEVMDFVSDAKSTLKEHLDAMQSGSTEVENSPFFTVLEAFRTQYARTSPMAYYAALASTKARDNLFALHGCSNELCKTSDEMLKARRAAKDTLALNSFIVGFSSAFKGSEKLTRLCNELIADLTDLTMDANQLKGLEFLTTLNAILSSQEDVLASVQKTRLIFFIKRMVTWLENDTSPTIKAEACKTLTYILPHVSDIYGEHWSLVVKMLVNFWDLSAVVSEDGVISETGVLLVHASIKVYGTVRRLSRAEEPNDDLLDTINEHKDQIRKGLIGMLKSASEVSDATHQPLMTTNELLARELSSISSQSLEDDDELYPLLVTPSHPVQRAVFDLLHKQLPAAQEQISYDCALDDTTAYLPDKLISLIKDAPTMETLADESFEWNMPLSLQGYLNGWRLVFDHFDGSSDRVKGDYVNQLKESGSLPGLMDLTFDFLGHNRGRPINPSKFNIQEYTAGQEPNPQKDAQSLLTHLYYLTLFHLPSLAKPHFLQLRSRLAPATIKTWTAKHISPLIIATQLSLVTAWVAKTITPDPECADLTIKVSPRNAEVNISYYIDEQTMAIKITLPETYPLDAAKALSVHRVAIREEKWQSWLRGCAGVIAFSNGGVVDGISAWHRNVRGALQGHIECAICYSIVNEARELPAKRCSTCKHVFHSTCLAKWFHAGNGATCPLCRTLFKM